MNNEQVQYNQRGQKTKVPASELDFNMSVTDPSWGKDEINQALQDTLTKEYFLFDDAGNIILDDKTKKPKLSRKALWSMLGFFTRDMRLSNLSPGNAWKGEANEVEYCEYRLNLANDMLIEGYEECFNIVLERVAAKLELCQSKRGFLRNKMNTYTQENINTLLEPPKRNFMGMKDGGGRG